MITFRVESWAEYYSDPAREALWWEHYREFEPVHEGKMEMSPDVKTFEALDKAGALSIIVARRDGAMIGYCISIVRRHIHYSSICGFEDSYYLTQSERKGMTGYKLISEAIKELRRRGCVRGYFMTKEFISIARMFEHMGMTKMDTVYCLWLQDK